MKDNIPHRPKFFDIIVLVCSWIVVVLICLHQTSSSDKSSSYIENFRLKDPSEYTEAEVLFYEFDPTDFDSQPDGPITISKNDHDRLTKSLGQEIEPIDKYIRSEGDRLFAFNLLISNRIGTFRSLPDTRHAKCLQQASPAAKSSYDNPSDQSQDSISIQLNIKASIIICYYNEAPSALLRTIKSVLVRSPTELIEEIIVVDDFSRDGYASEDIKPFIKSKLVKIVRTAKREGLIRARLFGAEMARGDVLIFLDSHVEANVGWLEPLLEMVQRNKTDIACPVIDLINAETLIYSASPLVKGGLKWNLNFRWDSVPSEKLKTYDDFIKPIESPTMAGGLFAIERSYFYHLGSYDPQMELWGGENIELSLRTWMCGGRILILPCSRLGHIFRKTRPYGPEPGQPDSLLINSNRAAHIWLDDYIDEFIKANPSARSLGEVDVEQRLDHKAQLGCKNFTWFLDNVYPKLKDELTNDEIDKASSRPK